MAARGRPLPFVPVAADKKTPAPQRPASDQLYGNRLRVLGKNWYKRPWDNVSDVAEHCRRGSKPRDLLSRTRSLVQPWGLRREDTRAGSRAFGCGIDDQTAAKRVGPGASRRCRQRHPRGDHVESYIVVAFNGKEPLQGNAVPYFWRVTFGGLLLPAGVI